MTQEQYMEIQKALIDVACSLSALHDPLYVVGLHKTPGFLKIAEGMEELRKLMIERRPKNGSDGN